MNRNECETVKLLKGPMTRVYLKDVKDHTDGIISFQEKYIKQGLQCNMEGLEYDRIAQKMFLGHTATKGHHGKEVGGKIAKKGRRAELAEVVIEQPL